MKNGTLMAIGFVVIAVIGFFMLYASVIAPAIEPLKTLAI